MKGLYRKISVVLLLAMLFGMFSSVGVYATDAVSMVEEPVAVTQRVEESEGAHKATAEPTASAEATAAPAPSEAPQEPTVSQAPAEPTTDPTVSAAPDTSTATTDAPSASEPEGEAPAAVEDSKEEAKEDAKESDKESVNEEPAEKPQEETKESEKEESFYDQLMKLKTCKEVFELLTDDANYDKSMALTVEQVKALREYVQTLAEDDHTEILLEAIDQLLIALGADLDAVYGTELAYVLNMNYYNNDAKVYWAVIDAGRNVQDQSYVSSISLNSSSVTYGNPKGSWSGGTKLSAYYPGVSKGGNGETSKTLTITPKKGYYVTRVVVACCGNEGRVSPLNCETWKDSNAYEKTFSVSAQGSISTQLPAKAFAHTSKSSAYFILVSVAPVPTPLYVEYDYGNIKDYLGDSYSSSAFATASGWTTASSANVYKTDSSDGGIQTANTQFKYTYATNNTSGAASWKHTTNTLTDKAIADAAKAGYEFAGWAYTYYTSASASQTSGQYNNYKYTFANVYGSGNIGTGATLTLVTNVKLVAQWKKVATTSVNVEKVWDDQENNDNKRPESVTVSLYMDNEDTGKDVILKESNSWKGTFAGLAVGHKYTVKEDAVAGYTSNVTGDATNGFVITNTHQVETVAEITTVTKVWDDNDNQDGKRPDSVCVQFYAKTDTKGKVPVGDPVELNEGNKWTFKVEGLWKYYKGEEIEWSVEEVKDIKDLGYTPNVTGSAKDGFVVTNTHTPETISVSGTKTWNDANNQDGNRPDSITVRLYADGKEVESKTITATDNWKYTFTNLPKYADGKEITYTITEDAVDGYSTKINGYNITNSYTPGKTSVSVTKAWDDADNQDGKRPAEITVKLLADGKDTGKTVTLSQANNWSAQFTELDEKKAGKTIVYTVEEVGVDVDVYKTAITGNAEQGYVITNTHTPALVPGGITVTKTWDDAGDQDGERPESITVRLYGNGDEVESKTITSTDNWKYTFTNLPKYADGKEITYTITEDAVDGYSTKINGYNITNSYTPGKTSISVTKAWDDADNQDGKRPAEITVKLLADGKDTGKTVTLSQANNWSAQFTELDEKKAGKTIVYTVEEVGVDVDVYKTAITGNAEQGYVITNTHTPEKLDGGVSGEKIWNDNNNQDGIRPEKITVNLLANGKKVASQTVTAENGWKYTFTNLDKYADGEEIVYTVTEEAAAGYTASVNGYNITNTHTPEKLDGGVSGEKIWNDNNNQDGIRPEKITVNLLANGEKIASKTVTAKDGWKYTFTNLDKYADGKEIVYTVTEEAAAGYTASVNGYNITNTHEPEKLDGGVSGEKIWNDNNNQDGIRPEKITVNLLANGEKIASKTVTAKDGWKYTFTNLDKYADGEEIVYTVTEEAAAGYTASINGYNITNTHEPEKLDGGVSGEKIWNDNNNQDGIRPEKITVNLLANGEKIDSKTVTAKDGWKYTFTNLDKYADGKEIVYTVTEEAAAGYTASVNGYNITNTHTPEKLEGGVSGEKIWNDNNNQDGIRPEKITVNLLANGKKVATQNVTAENGWKYEFKNLDKYENGEEIKYTVTEEAVEGYTTEIEGYNITNTHKTETTNVTIEKKWVDNNDKEGKRPDSIMVQLYANGEKLGDAVKITAKDGWKYEFKDLDKYQNGKLVEYTVKETSEKYYVAKYTSKDGILTITNTFVDIPLTGDTINLLFWTMMVLGAGAVLGGIGFHVRRRRA